MGPKPPLQRHSYTDYFAAAFNACSTLVGPGGSFTASERGFRRTFLDVGTYLSKPKAPKTRPMIFEIWRRKDKFEGQTVDVSLCESTFTFIYSDGTAKQDVCVVQRSDGVKELLVRRWKTQSTRGGGVATLDFEVYSGIISCAYLAMILLQPLLALTKARLYL